ncbi:LysR family transcriptional regulator [Rhizobium sp. AU243]|uniref:LysR family transcriptional regulator n=1 Tax=Rhizobium sp. AU243 TaxID=2303425 RepID=UPI0010CB83C2|nr:LysR family transcriptional regulator [Rhizobium sp. AU243]TKV70794.1 LysR family transcriptional regulator [Rhizobium sp. AU243]
MNFAQIKSFHLVATLGTFAQAAARLNTTQPAVSARIAALERSLGVTLFDRSGHKVALTHEGRSFLQTAERLLLIEAQYLASTRSGKLAGTLKLGVADTVANSWFPDFLVELRTMSPNVVVELRVGSSYRLREELITRQIDIAILVGPIANPEVQNFLLCDCPMVFVAAPALELHNRHLSLSDLEPYDIYTFERLTRPFQNLASQVAATGTTLRLSPIGSLYTNVLLVRKGLGVGAVPKCVIEEDLATGRLKLLDVDFSIDLIRFVAAYLRGPDSIIAEVVARSAGAFLRRYAATDSIKVLYEEPKI